MFKCGISILVVKFVEGHVSCVKRRIDGNELSRHLSCIWFKYMLCLL